MTQYVDESWKAYPELKFPYKDFQVHLKRPLDVRETDDGVEIRQWGVTLPCSIQNLQSGLSDYFQSLLELTDKCFRLGKSDESHGKKWMRVVESIDYERFSQENSPMMYEEFKVKKVKSNGTLILKRGEETIITTPPFFDVKKGDVIGVMVKRGWKWQIVKMSNPRKVVPLSHEEADRLWNSLRRL